MSDFNFNLQNLLRSLQEIEKSSYAEKTVEIFGKDFTLGILTVDEQVQVHEFCSKYTNKIAYLLNFQVETLAHAIKGIDQEYFGKEKFFPTGEFDDQGKPIKKQKHVFWREIIHKWNSKLRDQLYKEYDQIEKDFNQSLENSVQFIEEPQEEPPPPIPDPQFKKINEKELPPIKEAYSESSFSSMEDSLNSQVLYDEKGNLTAEGNAILRALEKLQKNEKMPPGVEVRFDTQKESPTEETSFQEEEIEEPAFSKLQQQVANTGAKLVKANKSLTNLTQLHQYPQEEPLVEDFNPTLDAQQAAKAFKRIEQQRPQKKPVSKKPFQLSEKELANLSPKDRLKYDIERQKYEDTQRDRLKNEDDIQLTSQSKPLLGGAPPGYEKTVPSKYRVK